MYPDLFFPPKPPNYIPPKQNVLERLDDLRANTLLKKKTNPSLYTTINPLFTPLLNPPYNLSPATVLIYSNLRATAIKIKSKSPTDKQTYLTCATMNDIGFLSDLSTDSGSIWYHKDKLKKAGLVEVYRTFEKYKIHKIYGI